jgi:membrane-associated phospholipid phosphatase
MQLGTLRRVSEGEPVPLQLLPRHLRRPVGALLVACVAVIVGFAGYLAVLDRPGWPNSTLDPWIQTSLSRFPALLDWLPEVGTLAPVTLITLALVLACAATRRLSGIILAVVAEPLATGLTEYVLKPYVGAAIGQVGYPSGHATSMFALAAICAVLLVNPPRRRIPGALRLLVVLMALLFAAAVAAAMVAIGAHTFTDAAAGAAFGTGVVLTCALTLDWITSRVRPAPTARFRPGG